MQTIAVVDDDVYIGNMLEELLRREGYDVLRAYSGTEALLLFGERKPDLILLDLMLPGLSGEEVLAKITDVPVIVVSAKLDVNDKVGLLRSGAADYITKPFDTGELLARVAVQLRKSASRGAAEALSFDILSLDTDTHEAVSGAKRVRLTKTEFAIFKLLIQNPNRVMTKSAILDSIADDTPDCTENTLKVHVSNLRRKLREIGDRDFIEAVWGIGFKLQ